MTEEELILSLCREAGEEGTEIDLIKKFREKYRDQSDLIRKACQGGFKGTQAFEVVMWTKGRYKIRHLGRQERVR